MSSLWDANKGKDDKKSLYQNLNYLSKLTSQLEWIRNPGDRPVRIAYTGHGAPTATLISDDKAILDDTLLSSNLHQPRRSLLSAGNHQQRDVGRQQ